MKIFVTDKQLELLSDPQDCAGKMFDANEPDCRICEYKEICKAVCEGAEYELQTETAKLDKPSPKNGLPVTREFVVGTFMEVANKLGIPNSDLHVVTLANHDKLFIGDKYYAKASQTTLKLVLADETFSYKHIDQVSVYDILEKYLVAPIQSEPAESEPADEVEQIDETVGAIIATSLTREKAKEVAFTFDQIREMPVGEFIRRLLS